MTTGLPCPPWCIEGIACEGEHESDLLARVPATGCRPKFGAYNGFWFPGVNLRLYQSLSDNTPPRVALHIGGEDVDAQADLQLHEAKALHAELGQAIALLEGSEVAR